MNPPAQLHTSQSNGPPSPTDVGPPQSDRAEARAPSAQTEVTPPILDEDGWAAAVGSVRATSPRLGTSLAFGRLVNFAPPELVLAFSRQNAFHRGVVAGSGRAQVEQLLAAHFGAPVRLRIEESSTTTPASLSPAEREAELKELWRRDVEAKVRSHTSVQAALRLLGGEIEQIHLLENERADRRQDSSDEPS